MTTHRKIRFGFVFALLAGSIVWLAFLPSGHAQTNEEICEMTDGYGAGCDGFDDSGGGSADPTATPTPAPTPTPTPDPQDEHDDALALAMAAIDTELRAPGWNVWPPRPKQVVNLETFLLVTDNWETHDVSRTVGSVTVTVFAEPKKSFWTLTELTTGTVHTVECDGPGSEWVEDAADPECGWIALHSSDVTGNVELEVEIEFDLHYDSSYLGTSSTLDTRRSRPSATRELTVSEVQSFDFDVENVAYSPENPDTTEPGDNPDGSVPGEQEDDGNPFPDGLPVESETCSVWGEVGGGVVFVDVDTGLGFEIIVETYADGTQVVTISGDAGLGIGTDVPSLGAAISVNDSALGAYYKAEASAWGTIGAGATYVLPPGESVQDLLIDLAIDKGTGWGGELINGVGGIFGQQPIPEAPPADAVFVDLSIWGEGEVSGAFGAGDIQAAVGASGELGMNIAGVQYNDGRYSVVTTFFGNIEGQFKSMLGDQGLDINGQLVGEFQVETIFDEDGNMIEAIVQTSYGVDGDVLVDDEEDDGFTITEQQWTIDLTNPEAKDAFLWDPNILNTANEFGVTSGPHDFEVEDNTTTIQIGADLAVIEGGGKLEFGCTTLS